MKMLFKILIVLSSILFITSCSSLKQWFDSSPPTQEIVSKIEKINTPKETKKVTWPAVKRYVRWDNSARGTATYTAESGWVIVQVTQKSYDTWEDAGYSMRKDAADENSVALSKLDEMSKSAESWVGELWKSEAEKQKISTAIDDKTQNYRRLLQAVSSSHSKVHIDWKVEGSDNRFNQRRGKISATFEITLEKAPSTQDIDKYIETVRSIIDTKS
jgi:hypothetical protein